MFLLMYKSLRNKVVYDILKIYLEKRPIFIDNFDWGAVYSSFKCSSHHEVSIARDAGLPFVTEIVCIVATLITKVLFEQLLICTAE